MKQPFKNHNHRLYNPRRVLASSFFLGFLTLFYGVGVYPHAQPPTWRTRVSLLVWVIILDLSGVGGHTSSISYRQHSPRDHVTTQAPLHTYTASRQSSPRTVSVPTATRQRTASYLTAKYSTGKAKKLIAYTSREDDWTVRKCELVNKYIFHFFVLFFYTCNI